MQDYLNREIENRLEFSLEYLESKNSIFEKMFDKMEEVVALEHRLDGYGTYTTCSFENIGFGHGYSFHSIVLMGTLYRYDSYGEDIHRQHLVTIDDVINQEQWFIDMEKKAKELRIKCQKKESAAKRRKKVERDRRDFIEYERLKKKFDGSQES